MTDVPQEIDRRKPEGKGKTGAAILAAMCASYFMTQMSLKGVNFETLGVSSEVCKSIIIGTLTGIFAELTPKNFVDSVKEGILFIRAAAKSWRDAIVDGKE